MLLKVDAIMCWNTEPRIASSQETVRNIFAQFRRHNQREGAVLLTDVTGRLCGIFTNNDLARLLEQHRDQALDRPIREVMTSNPITLSAGTLAEDALETFRRCKIRELPLVDPHGRPVGLLALTDMIDITLADKGSQLLHVSLRTV